ncbi:MAG: outer membrane lipoprotein-sorting protein [Firmicutes bacterium]|nr:outer membrane lipoprotein-sorting protein [Bacillota bacterium]
MMKPANKAKRLSYLTRSGIREAWVLPAVLIMTMLIMSCSVYGGGLTAKQILDKVESTALLVGSGSAKIELITESKRGQQRSNTLQIYRKKDADDTEKQLLEYLQPADVAGTKLLSITKPDGKDSEIWLYMPALGKERRIAAQEMQTKFMGTDFTYEEISGTAAYKEDYESNRLDDDTFDGHKCYVLQLTPKEKSEYTFVKMWIWQDEFIPLKIEFYGRGDKLKKSLDTSGWKKNAKGKWEPAQVVMSDVMAGTKTIIKIKEASEADVPDDYFTVRYLRRR